MQIELTLPAQLTHAGNPVPAWFAAVGTAVYPGLSGRAGSVLHPREREYFSRLTVDRRRISFLLGRYAAKLALSRHLGGAAFTDIEIRPGVFGQPVVVAPTAAPAGLTICHCDNLALALAHSPEHILGIDVETFLDGKADFLESQACAGELDAAIAHELGRARFLCLLWTMKEALSKALRCGLTVPFHVLEVQDITPAAGLGGYAASFRNFGQYKCHSWVVGTNVVSVVLARTSAWGLDVGRVLAGATDGP